MTAGYVDYDEWWDDLTIEQKRAAYYGWLKSDTQSIHVDEPITDEETAEHVEYFDKLRKQVVWDQDRFPRPKAWDEDRFKDKRIMTNEEFRTWLCEQGQRDPSRRYG